MPNFLTSHALEIARGLAFCSLFGLLLALGLQTPFKALKSALVGAHLGAPVLGNFVLIPVLAAAIILHADLEQNDAQALIFLACAPFAPVVPLFVRMASGHLALATGITGLFPVFSALLTPCAVTLSFWLIRAAGHEMPSGLVILELLAASITGPLMLGIGFREWFPRLSDRIQKPMEWLSEAIGVLSLSYLSTLEAGHLAAFQLREAGPFVAFYEMSFVIGLALGQGPFKDRVVMGFGTANRNIGLAILLAAATTSHPDLLGNVLAQSLLMLTLGLIHVALVRLSLCSAQFCGWIGSDKPSSR